MQQFAAMAMLPHDFVKCNLVFWKNNSSSGVTADTAAQRSVEVPTFGRFPNLMTAEPMPGSADKNSIVLS